MIVPSSEAVAYAMYDMIARALITIEVTASAAELEKLIEFFKDHIFQIRNDGDSPRTVAEIAVFESLIDFALKKNEY